MGTYKVPEISVVTRDFFGFVPRCVPHPIDCEVEVVPEYATMPPLRISVAGKTSHSGSVDARISGESTNFLGLRGFRHGDSIRRIDWKKSEKCGGLIVREFERLNSTDATIIIDQRQISHFEYEELNSFEVLKDTAVALCRSLMDQRIRVQFITRDYVLDFGKGAHFFDHLVELVRDLRPNSAEPFEDFVHRHRELVPPDSVVIPLFAAVDLKIDSLLETFWTWDMVRAEVIPVLIDVNSFDRKIASRAKVDTQEQENLRAVREMYGDLSGHKPYESLARKISAKSILIGPDETIGEVYARSSPWGR